MALNKTERSDCRRIASELGLPEGETRKAVASFFDAIKSSAFSLPLDDRRRIYTRDAFDSISRVWQIPYVGRLGFSYSRYLQWRRNESKDVLQEKRSAYRLKVPQSEIEAMAADILSGKAPAPLKKRKKSELFDNVWLVGKDGKKLARQVMPKKK